MLFLYSLCDCEVKASIRAGSEVRLEILRLICSNVFLCLPVVLQVTVGSAMQKHSEEVAVGGCRNRRASRDTLCIPLASWPKWPSWPGAGMAWQLAGYTQLSYNKLTAKLTTDWP